MIITSSDPHASHQPTPHSPIRNVPDELWPIIFLWCIPSNPSCEDYPTKEAIRDPRNVPIVLASISCHLRGIVCSAGELWATCWVSFWHPELNTIWLGRAGRQMLHLYGSYYHRFVKHDFDWNPLLQSILPFQNRWKTIEVEITNWGNPADLDVELDCPALESFRLHHDLGIPRCMSKLIPNSPRLREIALGSLQLGIPISMARHHLPLLTSLKIGWSPIQDVVQALSILPQLQHLEICLDEDDIPQGLPALTHSNLVSLVLGIRSGTQLLLNNLKLPSLRQFRAAWFFDHTAFLDFVHRSDCRIKELSLEHCCILDEVLVTMLQDQSIGPWLEKLDLAALDSSITPGLLHTLGYCQGGLMLPNLTRLSLRDCTFADIPEGFVADFVTDWCGRSVVYGWDCKGHCLERRAGDTQVQNVLISYLNTNTHNLDVARLTPLPGERRVDDKGSAAVLDLTVVNILDLNSRRFRHTYPIKVFLGSCLCKRDVVDDL